MRGASPCRKKYLKWYNKVGYGSGDIAGNVIYAFLSTFMMFYLTEKVGMNIGIVGTLMALSKLFDGGPVLSTYLGTSLLIQYFTFDLVELLGGGVEGWKWIAVIYAAIGLVSNTVSGLSVKELPAEELDETGDKEVQEQEEK